MPQTTLPVSFGSVTFRKSATVGVSVERESMTVNQADKLLCGRRLTGRIIALPKGENEDQGKLEGFDEKLELDGIFDVKRIGATPDKINFGLSFALAGLDRESLSMFCGRSGKLTIKSSESMPNGDGDSDPEDDDDDDEATAE